MAVEAAVAAAKAATMVDAVVAAVAVSRLSKGNSTPFVPKSIFFSLVIKKDLVVMEPYR